MTSDLDVSTGSKCLSNQRDNYQSYVHYGKF